MSEPKQQFMEAAIREAELARRKGDYAIGAVIVRRGKILSRASSRSKRDENPIAHAEVLAIVKASRIHKRRHLSDCTLYSTHEPCPMCASVAVWAKLKGIVYGSRIADMKRYARSNGNRRYQWRTIGIPCREVVKKSKEHIEIIGGFMREKCVELFHN